MNHNPYAPPVARVDDKEPVGGRLYSPVQMIFAAFLGSPIAAAWLAARNYAALGEPRKKRLALIIGSVASAVFVVVAMFIPDTVPALVFPLAQTVAVGFLAVSQFRAIVTHHLANGGVLASWWRVVGIGFLFALVIIVVVAVAVFGSETMGVTNLSSPVLIDGLRK